MGLIEYNGTENDWQSQRSNSLIPLESAVHEANALGVVEQAKEIENIKTKLQNQVRLPSPIAKGEIMQSLWTVAIDIQKALNARLTTR